MYLYECKTVRMYVCLYECSFVCKIYIYIYIPGNRFFLVLFCSTTCCRSTHTYMTHICTCLTHCLVSNVPEQTFKRDSWRLLWSQFVRLIQDQELQSNPQLQCVNVLKKVEIKKAMQSICYVRSGLENSVACQRARLIYGSTAWYSLQDLMIGQNII